MPNILVASQSTTFRAGIQALLSGDPVFCFYSEIHPLIESISENSDLCIWICTQDDIDWLVSRFSEPLKKAHGVLVIGDDPGAFEKPGLPTTGWGILPVHASSEALRFALFAIDQGLVVLPPATAAILIDSHIAKIPQAAAGLETLLDPLSEREIEVLSLLGQGLQNKQIAHAFSLSENTVKFHISSIYSKLAVTNRTEAAAKGMRLGLLAQ